MTQAHRTTTGFTLVETLIAIVLIGLALAIATPRISTFREQMELDAAAQQLAGDLGRARIEAIKRNAPVSLRKIGAGSYDIEFLGNRALRGGAVLTGAPDSVRFASFGPPVSGPTDFTVTLGSRSKIVAVNAAGYIEVK